MKRSEMVATCLAVLMLVTAPLTAQDRGRAGESQKRVEVAAEPPLPAGGEQPAVETREQLRRLFRQYPPSLPQVLQLDPSLLASGQYLGTYPALSSFVGQHPEIVHNPVFFLGAPGGGFQFEATGRFAALNAMQRVLAGLTFFLGFVLVMGLTAWGLKTLIDHRRWLRVTEIQTDAHSKLLDRLTSNEDLLAYIQTAAGRQFLEGAPLPTSPRPQAISPPINRILWSVQAGVVVLLGGAGLWAARSFVVEEVAQLLSVLGVLNMFLGAGFVLSALVAYVLSKALGLFESPALHPHA
jgi:hypothetical protein